MGEPLGLSIASHSGRPASAVGALAGAAGRAGFSAVLVAGGHGDALALCHPAAAGRFVLGLGVGNAVMNARFGIAPFAPLPMIEEYVGVIRSVLSGAAGYDGQLFRTGMVPLDSPPVRAGWPVYLGLSQDPAAAAAAARAAVLRYVLHPAVPRLFGGDLREVRELVLAGDRAGAADRVPQQVADGFVAHGSAATCAARLTGYRAAGVDLPVVFPVPVGGDWGYERTT